MGKISCELSVDKLRYETELRKRVLIKRILKKNIEKGIVPAHEEKERWDNIKKIPNHVIRLRLNVMSGDLARKLTT